MTESELGNLNVCDKKTCEGGLCMEAYPKLSVRERDRRWALTKELMKSKGIDCLILVGLNSFHNMEWFLSNDFQRGMIVFPMEGEPTYLVGSNMYVVSEMENRQRGEVTWIEDWRGGVTGKSMVDILKEKGFESAKIGVLGLKGEGIIGDPEGSIPYTTWTYVLDHLPKATFTDISASLIEKILVKSEEELALVRYAAHVGEMACQADSNAVKPGVSESEIYAAAAGIIFMNGANFRNINLLSGVDNPSWGRPKWLTRPQRSRIVQKGEIVLSEWGPSYGGLEAQQQMTVALKPVHPVNRELAEVAKQSLEAGLKALQPGKTFREVCDMMEKPIATAGCWHLTPLIHSINPLLMVSQRQVGMIDNLPGIKNYDASRWEKGEYKGVKARSITGGDIIIKAGMSFAMEPNACRGKHRVNIGGTAIVTEHGVEELNTLPNEMRMAD